jgi:hypothetical protein
VLGINPDAGLVHQVEKESYDIDDMGDKLLDFVEVKSKIMQTS